MTVHLQAFLPIKPRFAGVIAAVLAVLALVPGCGRNEESSAKPEERKVVLAEVGGEVITAQDLVAEAKRRAARRQPVPGKEALLDLLVERASLLHRTRELGLEEDPEIRRSLENMLIAKLRERELEQQLREVEATEEELRKAYDEGLTRFTRPAMVRLAILHLKSDAKQSDVQRAETQARLNEARKIVLEHPPSGGRGPAAGGFGALAIRYSDDQVSRYRGGDAGWIEVGRPDARWPAKVVDAGLELAGDEVSEVMAAEGGFYLVRKTDFRPAQTTPFEKAAPLLRQRVLAEKREELTNAFRSESKSLAGTKIYPDALTGIELPGAAAPVADATDEQKPPSLPGTGN